jgi:hypothetical protein
MYDRSEISSTSYFMTFGVINICRTGNKIWPVFLIGCGTCSFILREKQKIRCLKIWCLGRYLIIRGTNGKTGPTV